MKTPRTRPCSFFEQLVGKLRSHAPDNFSAWLYATARNFCLMELRARQRGTASGGPLLLLPEASDVENAAARHLPDVGAEAEAAGQHEANLQALELAPGPAAPPSSAAAWNYFYQEEKSYQEIVATTGLALNLVKSHLQNGRRMLKRTLSKELRMGNEE